MKKKPLLWLMIITCIVLLFQVKNFMFVKYKVEGVSMDPTFTDGTELLINKFSPKLTKISRFDYVLFHGPKNQILIKRVIGLPGESIKYVDDQLFVNGEKWKEPYLKEQKKHKMGNVLTGDFQLKAITGQDKIKKNHYFVIGDNRIHSFDSRHFGTISKDQVVGVKRNQDE
ncbi:signal peptidase [Bacillus safensis]|uniref:signal peptidase I n=1 Tax=Bacillus TaxID=1386 RepID=UPI00040E10FD|nr:MULTISPECIES: signal peptidase I [Bacillus]PNU23759.1 signal peptidase I [Bacillus stratosphericus]APJ10376.1 signal peptidase I [Bacillus safensis]AYJ89590.1 signal peptidase I [Bacillus safensis]KAB3539252.1 signal peptidase I [Bacillus safensis]KAB3544883.1 signal peptidase I [Bacillus safensis]